MKKHCLKEEDIVDYLKGRLDRHERQRLESHLSNCDQCMDMVRAAGRIFKRGVAQYSQKPPPAVSRRAIGNIENLKDGNWWDRLMGRLKALSLAWTRMLKHFGLDAPINMASACGNKVKLADDLILLDKSFDNLDTEIEIEKIDQERANVQVSIFDARTDEPPVRVALVRNNREIASYLASKHAAFFESIPFGRYQLVFTRKGTPIGQCDFNIKAAGDGIREA